MRCILVATSAYVSLELTSEVPTQGSGDAGAVDLAKAMVDCPGEGLMALRLRGHQARVPSPSEPRNAVDMAPFGLKTDQKRVGALPEPQEIYSSTMAYHGDSEVGPWWILSCHRSGSSLSRGISNETAMIQIRLRANSNQFMLLIDIIYILYDVHILTNFASIS